MPVNALESALRTGAERMGLALDLGCIARLAAYLKLLDKWNRVYNLTAVRDLGRMVTDHVFDSLAVREHLVGKSLLDLGSGAGLPGIPLALASSDLNVCLLDASAKKTRFLIQVQTELAMENLRIVNRRAEDYFPLPRFDTVVSRAFGSLADFARIAADKCAEGGRMLAMKGRRPDAEIAAIPEGFKVSAIHALKPYGVRGERCLVVIGAER